MAHRLKLAIIGDPHIAVPRGNDDPYLEADPGRKLHGLSTELLRATIEQVNAVGDLDLALVMGDLTRDSEEFNHAVARELLSTLAMPYYIVVGNHDFKRKRPEGTGYPDAHRLDRDEMTDWYYDRGLPNGMTRYVVELPGDVVLTVLNSNRTMHELAADDADLSRQDDGLIGEDQLAWLEGVLQQIVNGGRVPLIAVHHSVTDHSPAEEEGHMLHRVFRFWQVKDGRAFRELAAKYRVPLVLSGHLHAQSISTEDGVTNLVTAASVSYPHAWRLLTFTDDAVEVESRRIESIPSCTNLQEQSRQWLGEGMGQLIEDKSAAVPMASGFARELREFITRTGWWPSFCDGTQAQFAVSEEDIPQNNPVMRMVFSQVAKKLNEFGTWKAARPDPNNLSIPLTPPGD